MSYAQPQATTEAPVTFTSSGRPMSFDTSLLSPSILLKEALERPTALHAAVATPRGLKMADASVVPDVDAAQLSRCAPSKPAQAGFFVGGVSPPRALPACPARRRPGASPPRRVRG